MSQNAPEDDYLYTINLLDYEPALNIGNIRVLNKVWCDNYAITDTDITYTLNYKDVTSANPDNPNLENILMVEWEKIYVGGSYQAYRQRFNKTNEEKTNWSEYGEVIDDSNVTGIRRVTHYDHELGIVTVTDAMYLESGERVESKRDIAIDEYTPELWYPAIRSENDIWNLTEHLGSLF